MGGIRKLTSLLNLVGVEEKANKLAKSGGCIEEKANTLAKTGGCGRKS